MPSPYPPSQTPANDPYGFITNTPPKAPKSFGPTTTKGRIIIVAVGAVLLIIVAIIISSLLGNAGKAQTEQYLAIAKSQTEIIRLSTNAEQKAKTPEAQALATTTKLTFTTAQADMSTLLNKRGIGQKALSKQLSASANTKSDELLTEAEKNNRYDETYLELVKTEVENYKKLLNTAASGAAASEVPTLENAFNQANTIFTPETAAN